MNEKIYNSFLDSNRHFLNDETVLLQLTGLMEIGTIINSTLELQELLKIVMEIAKKVMNAEASSLLLVDEQNGRLYYEVALGDKAEEVKKLHLDIGQGIAGWVANEDKSLIVDDVSKDSRFCPDHDKTSGFKTRAVACVPLKTKRRIVGVLEAINPVDGKSFLSEDLRLLEVIGSQAAVAIENARMHGELLKKQRVEQEMEIARQIQKSFLPEVSLLCPEFSLDARNDSFWEVGGDFYDIVKFPKGRIGVLIGDVSGKGVPAALLMVKAMTDFRFECTRFSKAEKVIEGLNMRLVQREIMGMFITLCYMVFDPVNKIIEIVNSGHPPVLRLRKGKVEFLEDPNEIPPVGIFPDQQFSSFILNFEAHDRFFLYTDGLAEARNSLNEEFGLSRLLNAFRLSEGSESPVDTIFQEVIEFSGKEGIKDDLTAVCISCL
ncbi:MAG: SpoIIE family protein phosphatase [Candidatus Theseobacter exili]|nr:SpoIIE family protein phosphatase [Candidatus Theseobacter exili]